MPRDKILKKAFEFADDGMQGVVGYFYYVNACQHIAKEQIIIDYLPHTAIPQDGLLGIQYYFQMFHQWLRGYNPEELIKSMNAGFINYHIRTCLIGIISIFEAYLSDSISRLVQIKIISKSKIKDSYKHRLVWAFEIILNSNYGNPDMQNRRPKLCLDIDHARRIRNLWLHNNGNFDKRYGTDTIPVSNEQPIIVSDYYCSKNLRNKKIPFPIDISLFETISRSHIEALHHINHMLQTKYFNQKRTYNYKQEKKKIEWSRIFGV